MKNNTQMEEMSVKQIIDKYNFIVPEIQREYGWGNNDFRILDGFYNDLEEKNTEYNSLLQGGVKSLKDGLNKILTGDSFKSESIKEIFQVLEKFESKSSLNIGFLYSYKPNYYFYNDVSEDVFLIDGQQRFTTLFLSLFF